MTTWMSSLRGLSQKGGMGHDTYTYNIVQESMFRSNRHSCKRSCNIASLGWHGCALATDVDLPFLQSPPDPGTGR